MPDQQPQGIRKVQQSIAQGRTPSPSTSSPSQATDDSASNDDPSLSSYFTFGKQKLISAVKSTKESSYFKTFSTAIQQTLTIEDPSTPVAPQEPTIPDDAEITLYQTYARFTGTEYVTEIVGSVSSPGLMNRKNRLLISLVQRLTKANTVVPPAMVNQLESELEDSITHPDLKNSNSTDSDTMSTYSMSTTSGVSTDIIKDRLQGVIARSIARTPIKITVGSEIETDNLLGANLYSDAIGFFRICIATPYPPSYAAVSSGINSQIICTRQTKILEPKGVSIISDVDDTVRITGVVGDRREVFRNIFAKEFSECEVPRLANWYQALSKDYSCSIHYVSNSPWQVYNIVSSFIDFVGLPVDSIHLRQYSGNLIQSFMQPSAERKKSSLLKIIQDFPKKKFILVGDSGEMDLEAYLSMATMFPDRILGIYIRALTGAFSSYNEDVKVFKELQETLKERKVKHVKVPPSGNPPASEDEPQSEAVIFEQPKGIEDMNIKKLPPIPPAKPKKLRGEPILHQLHSSISTVHGTAKKAIDSHRTLTSGDTNVPLPHSKRSETFSVENDIPPALPSRRTATTITGSSKIPFWGSNSQYDYPTASGANGGYGVGEGVTEEPYDKKKVLWRERINRVVNELPECIEFKFWWDPQDVMEDSLNLVENELKRQKTAAEKPTSTSKKISKLLHKKKVPPTVPPHAPKNLIDL